MTPQISSILRQSLRTAALVVFSVTLVVFPTIALAQQGAAGLINPIGCQTLGECLAWLVRAALALVAIAALGFIVYGGFLYITAGGNDDQLRQGKQAITGAVIGIVVIGLAFAIVEFVARALGVDGGAPRGPAGGGL